LFQRSSYHSKGTWKVVSNESEDLKNFEELFLESTKDLPLKRRKLT